MRILLYEYTCGSSLANHPELASLRGEGAAMLRALLEDAACLPGVEPVTLLDPATSLNGLPAKVRIRWLQDEDDEEGAIRAEARAADWTCVIAPESDDILATRCGWVEAAGGRTLNSSCSAIALTGDKLALAATWRTHGVPMPATLPWPAAVPPDWFPVVWKPRFGAGSQATFLLQSPDECHYVAERARAEGYTGPAIVTRYVPGQPASIAWLIGPRARLALPPAYQHLSTDGRFHYLGGELPLPAGLAERAVRLSRAALDVVPGLYGYVGVDLVLGDAADGSQDQLVEINPRLTTSYLGLRRLVRGNLVQALLDVARGEPVELQWNPSPIRFDGR